MKEIVNITLHGAFYCDGKDIMFNANGGIIKKMAALIGAKIIRDGTFSIVLSENSPAKERSKKA